MAPLFFPVIEQSAENKLGRWSAPEIPFSIEYLLEVMDSIRDATGRAGEAGGVLFGTREQASIRILTWRPILLPLSAGDQRDLVRLLLAAKQDPALQDLQPLGWFVSRVDGNISLREPDLEIYNGFFGEPWQVTLVLRPTGAGVARAGYFAREASGSLRSGSCYQEFDIEPLPRGASIFATMRQRVIARARWVWTIPVVLAVILAGAFLRQPPAGPGIQGFSLRLQGGAPKLQIEWDPNSAPVRAASRADIDIQDGGQPSHFSFEAAQLRTGKMTWQRHTGDVLVRMTVYPDRGGALRESASLKIVTIYPPPVPRTDPAQAQVKQLNEELRIERARADRLRQMVKILENRIEVDAARK